MSLTLDQNQRTIQIDLYYVEKTKTVGTNSFSVLSFISSEEEMNEWKAKGYKTELEIQALSAAKPDAESMPGSPETALDKAFDPTKVIHRISTHWKKMNWSEQNSVFRNCINTTPAEDGKMHTNVDTIAYRDLKLKTCLADWDVTDINGSKVPVTEGNIDQLPPEVAMEMINAFEKITEAAD